LHNSFSIMTNGHGMSGDDKLSQKSQTSQKSQNSQKLVSKPPRTRWDSRFQFLISMLSFCIGLGNLWRFPFLIQKWGGGSFVLAFVIMMIVEGLPLLLLEFMVGQYHQVGALQIWLKHHPMLGGIGLASAFEAFLIGSYYIAIVNWGFYYFFNTFTTGALPWAACPVNGTSLELVQECELSSPTVYFFYRKTMNISESISESNGFQWWILIVFILTWTVVYVVISKGIETSGKVMYVTATFPYLVLTIFLVRGLTLEGAADGLSYITAIKTETLLDVNMWLDAACQVFYSLSIGVGGNIAFASYNPRNQNCMRDAMIVGFANIGTALYVAVVIFSILGFKATTDLKKCIQGNLEYASDLYDIPEDSYNYESYDQFLLDYPELENDENLPVPVEFCDFNYIIENGVQGIGLAFIVITEAINNMPAPSVFSFLFFLMLLMLGMGSLFGSMEGFITPLFDFANDINIKIPKPLLTLITCVISCLVGLVFCLDTGYYWVDIFNEYSVNLPLLVIGMVQLIICCWVFGISNWMNMLVEMLGPVEEFNTVDKCLFYMFHFLFRYISPVALIIVFIGLIYSTIVDSYVYEAWDSSIADTVLKSYDFTSILVIVLLPAVPIAIIPIFAGLYLCGWKNDTLLELIGGKPLLKKENIMGNLKRVLVPCGQLDLNKDE